jgi:hypothetical protein
MKIATGSLHRRALVRSAASTSAVPWPISIATLAGTHGSLRTTHQVLSTKTAVAAYDDSRASAIRGEIRSTIFDNRFTAFAARRCPPAAAWRTANARHKKCTRQVAVAVAVAVKESAQLVAVDRIVGGVEVEHDFLGGWDATPGTFHEKFDVVMPATTFL